MFTSLHIKSANSLLQSPHSIERYIEDALAKGYKYVVLNEYQTLSSALSFYRLAKQNDLIPIIAITFELDTVSLSVFANNEKGYFELVDLSTQLLSDNQPIDLLKYTNITILFNTTSDHAVNFANYLREHTTNPIFFVKSDFSNGMQEYADINFPFVLSKPVYYLYPSDLSALKVLKAIQENKTLSLETLEVSGSDYLLSADDYKKWCQQDIVAYDTTKQFIQSIALSIPTGQNLLPNFSQNADELLREKAYEGLVNKQLHKEPYIKRLDKELKIIAQMGFSNYFLIVWDLMAYAHQQGIMMGAGRGSSAASLVSYCLQITNVDPVKYHLLFERFLNPQRRTMPDIDLDFPDNRRQDMLNYAAQKYGEDKVAQIATFGTFAPKQALRDVARVLGATSQELKTWSTAIGNTNSLKNTPKAVNELAGKTIRHQMILRIAKQIEGLPRHLSTHAAGVVISDKALNTLIPVQKKNNQLLLTQFDMTDVQAVGLLKMDFLGLRNLSILADAVSFVQQTNKHFDIWKIDFQDHKTLELFSKGQTDGIFQFESPGIKRVLRQVKPNSLEEVAIVNALYRPGPMEQINVYVKRKFKKEPVIYLHDDLTSILNDTKGIIVYQEQIMLIANRMAGYSIGQADLLRRAIAKMDKKIMANEKNNFISGAINKGYSPQVAQQVFSYIEKFANYGFPKSHAFAYSVLAFQLAYLKANYPHAFYLALLLHTNPKSSRYVLYMTQARQYDVTFKLPDINKSRYTHQIIDEKTILFGLSAIQGLRYEFLSKILSERRQNGSFQSLEDFIHRLDDKNAKLDNITPLIYAGCFDHFKETRASLIQQVPLILNDRDFFGGGLLPLKKISVPEFTTDNIINYEKQYLGFSMNQTMNDTENKWYDLGWLTRTIDVSNNDTVSLMGILKSVRKITTKNNKRMAFATLEDTFGTLNITIFPEVYQRFLTLLDSGNLVYLIGKIQNDNNDDLVCIASYLQLKEEAIVQLTEQMKHLYIKIESKKQLDAVYTTLKKHKGNTPVSVYVEEEKTYHKLDKKYAIQLTQTLLLDLELKWGKENIVIRENIS